MTAGQLRAIGQRLAAAVTSAETTFGLRPEGESSVFKTVTLTDWRDIHPYAARSGWIFRGQRAATWELKTSLERCCDRLAVAPRERRTIEDRIVREFRRAYHQFAFHVPHKLATPEWLALMQHHGAPTRLLDFTYSVYVAAYFAVEEADGDSAVWAIDGPWALKRSAAVLRAAGKRGTHRMGRPFMDEDERIIRPLVMRRPYVPAAWPINPFRLNERLRVQQGVFLIQGDVSKPFAANLAALLEDTATNHIVKIVLPESLRREALQRLWSMDISRAALFPGLDGFARSLGINHSLFHPTQWTARALAPRRTRGRA